MKGKLGERVGWRFLLTWIAAGSFSLLFGVAAGFPALWWLSVLGARIGETAAFLVSGVVFGLLLGCGVGLGQALALRAIDIVEREWVVASGVPAMVILGSGIGLLIRFGEDLPDVMAGIVLGFLLGFSTSLGQWWLLRKKFDWAGWWLVLGTLIPSVVMGVFLPFGGEGRELAAVLGVAVGTAVLTGLAMFALLRGMLPRFRSVWFLGLLLPLVVLGVMTALGAGRPSYPPPLPPVDADQHLIFHNGVVLTMDERLPEAQAVAVEGDKITAVGSNEEILALERPDSVVVDLRGRTLMPGFVDAHSHLFNDAEQYFGMNLAEVQEIGLRNGITALGDLFVNEGFLREMREFEAAGQLRIRTSLYLIATDNCGRLQGDWWQDYEPERPVGGMLHVTGIKIFTDGGTCERPALSYELRPGEGLGDLFLEQSELDELVLEVQEAGFQVAIHAIGDRAVEEAQTAIEAALDGEPNELRHRIDHNSVIRPELLARYGEIGIVPVVFGLYPVCEPFGPPPPEAYQSWEWPTRALIEANPGLPVAWHGDDPFFGRVRPLDDLYSLVTRDELTEGGVVCEAPEWHEQHTVTVEQALRMMTVNGAYAIWRDGEIGRLAPGYYADLIVLNDNPLGVETAELKYLDVRLTMVGGRVEYCAVGQGWLCPN